MSNIPAELRALPLDHIIGAPLVAAINAQALAAKTTVDFIKEVGLKALAAGGLTQDTTLVGTGETADAPKGDDTSLYEARYVEFKFDRVVEERVVVSEGTPAVEKAITRYSVIPSRLTVPLLTIVPIPFIRISDMTIEFEYKIRDFVTSESTKEAKVDVQAKAGTKYYSVTATGSYSSRSTTKRETDSSSSLKITVHATQDQMPEGLRRVLDMLGEGMKVVPLSAPAKVPGALPSG